MQVITYVLRSLSDRQLLQRYLPPGTFHFVLTPSEVVKGKVVTHGCMIDGAHFYNFLTMPKTMIGRLRVTHWSGLFTNADKAECVTLLHRMAFLLYLDMHLIIDIPPPSELQRLNDLRIGDMQYSAIGALCLAYQILAPESLEPRDANGTSLYNPDEGLAAQGWNARAVMIDFITKVREAGGWLWQLWLRICTEMDDRILNKDDVLSPFRLLILEAQRLCKSNIRGTKLSVLDIKFLAQRYAFFSTPSHAPTIPFETESADGLPIPASFPPWSHVAHGTVSLDYNQGTVDEPGVIQVNLPLSRTVFPTLTGKKVYMSGNLNKLSWTNYAYLKIQRHIEEMGADWRSNDGLILGTKHSKNWIGFDIHKGEEGV